MTELSEIPRELPSFPGGGPAQAVYTPPKSKPTYMQTRNLIVIATVVIVVAICLVALIVGLAVGLSSKNSSSSGSPAAPVTQTMPSTTSTLRPTTTVANSQLVASFGPTIQGHMSPIKVVSSLGGTFWASGADDGSVTLWNGNTLQATLDQSIGGHESRVSALAPISSTQMASGAFDSTVKVWNANTLNVATYTGHTFFVTALVYVGGNLLASGSFDQTVKVWDISNASSPLKYSLTQTGPVNTLASLGSNLVASGCDDSTLKVCFLKQKTKIIKDPRFGSRLKKANFFICRGLPLQGEYPISFSHTHTCSGPISFYRFYPYLYMGHVRIFEYIVSF